MGLFGEWDSRFPQHIPRLFGPRYRTLNDAYVAVVVRIFNWHHDEKHVNTYTRNAEKYRLIYELMSHSSILRTWKFLSLYALCRLQSVSLMRIFSLDYTVGEISPLQIHVAWVYKGDWIRNCRLLLLYFCLSL